MARPCSSAHCSGIDPELNAVCKSEGWPVNHPVITRDAQGPCQCSCSCLAHGTPVQSGDRGFKAIESYQVGDSVLACGRDLNWAPRDVVFSQGTTGASRQKYTVLVVYGEDSFLAVTSDHLFFMADKTLKRADRLTVRDRLLSPDEKPVTIRSVHIGDYTAGFHHIATAKKAPPADLSGHLINTNGVVSADYALQLFGLGPQGGSLVAAGMSELPVVGSPEYVSQHGEQCLHGPALASKAFAKRNVLIGAANAPDLESAVFVPAAATRLQIPKDACRFISDEDARSKMTEARRRWNDPASREWTEYLIDQHRTFFPGVTYHLDWADDTVNAYAWVQNGVRHVAILGGLVRHMALELEGVAVVLAHELAHHYGGSPTYPGGLSCEGQADYAGVSRIMRRVWFGNFYTQVTDAGILQMANFFGVPNNPNAPGGNAGCTHPPGACRVATYHAAVALSGKPGCAG